jgi:hypothetical protein
MRSCLGVFAICFVSFSELGDFFLFIFRHGRLIMCVGASPSITATVFDVKGLRITHYVLFSNTAKETDSEASDRLPEASRKAIENPVVAISDVRTIWIVAVESSQEVTTV